MKNKALCCCAGVCSTCVIETREELKDFYWLNETKMLMRSLLAQDQAPVVQMNSSRGPDCTGSRQYQSIY